MMKTRLNQSNGNGSLKSSLVDKGNIDQDRSNESNRNINDYDNKLKQKLESSYLKNYSRSSGNNSRQSFTVSVDKQECNGL